MRLKITAECIYLGDKLPDWAELSDKIMKAIQETGLTVEWAEADAELNEIEKALFDEKEGKRVDA